MNKGLIIFLLIIPILAALGHDAYIYYQNQEEGFKLSDLGWVWTHYHPESHDQAFQAIGKEQWKQYLLPILSLPTAAATAIISFIILLIIMIFKACSAVLSGAFSREAGKGSKNSKSFGRDRGEAKRFQYKR